MALSKLSGDEQCIIFSQLCNTLDARVAVAFSSTNSELRTLTQALLQQLRADNEVAVTLGRKARMQSCKELREAKKIDPPPIFTPHPSLSPSAADLATLGTLGSVLPALETLCLVGISPGVAGPDGVQRLAAGLGAGTLPAVKELHLSSTHVGDAGAVALAAALGRGAMPRLTRLWLSNTGIGDAGLVALAPALRRLPALEKVVLIINPLGDEGLAALVAPPPPVGALPPPTGVLTKLKQLTLSSTKITDAGCASLADALDSGSLPALDYLRLYGIPASAASKAAVTEAVYRNCGLNSV